VRRVFGFDVLFAVSTRAAFAFFAKRPLQRAKEPGRHERGAGSLRRTGESRAPPGL
jgi:hypothetical protein